MKLNITLAALMATATLFSACSTDKKQSSGQDSIVKSPSGQNQTLDSLKTFAGKYPQEVGLLENGNVKTRLMQLLGNKYAAFIKSWNTESPISIEKNVLGASGCEQHNCGDNNYLLYIDFATDNINIYHIINGHLEVYQEKGQFVLPDTLKQDFDAVTSDIEH